MSAEDIMMGMKSLGPEEVDEDADLAERVDLVGARHSPVHRLALEQLHWSCGEWYEREREREREKGEVR